MAGGLGVGGRINTLAGGPSGSAASQMQNIINKGLRSQSEPAQQPTLKQSESATSFMENIRQRAAFSVVMKAMMLPKQPKR